MCGVPSNVSLLVDRVETGEKKKQEKYFRDTFVFLLFRQDRYFTRNLAGDLRKLIICAFTKNV